MKIKITLELPIVQGELLITPTVKVKPCEEYTSGEAAILAEELFQFLSTQVDYSFFDALVGKMVSYDKNQTEDYNKRSI